MIPTFVLFVASVGISTNATLSKPKRPPGWGKSRFHVQLKGCLANEGGMSPSFDPFSEGPYEIRAEPEASSVIINPILDLRKYQPRFTPKITFGETVVDYVPTRTIDLVYNFSSFTGYDETLPLTIADPGAGYLTGNSMTYYIRIKKMPNPAITSLKYLKLTDSITTEENKQACG